jgi:hypothetical protein
MSGDTLHHEIRWNVEILLFIGNIFDTIFGDWRFAHTTRPTFFSCRFPPYFATAPFSHTTTRSAFMEGSGVLTARRVRDITSLSS